MSLAVSSVSDAPSGADNAVTMLEDTAYVFKATDFGFSDAQDAASNAGANNFVAVTISSLPAAGTLTDNGVAMTAGQSIAWRTSMRVSGSSLGYRGQVLHLQHPPLIGVVYQSRKHL